MEVYMKYKRSSGLLMPLSSLPSKWGIGDFGKGAFDFLDFLKASEQTYWQILPLSLTDPYTGNSPYNSPSAFAIDPDYINPDLLLEEGLVDIEDLENIPNFSEGTVDYKMVRKAKGKINRKAFARFMDRNGQKGNNYISFCEENDYWLRDLCLFFSIREKLGPLEWQKWPDKLKNRDKDQLEQVEKEKIETFEYCRFLQYKAAEQWSAVRRKCASENIKIIGDIPIYVSLDSPDVWGNRHLFQLDSRGYPMEVGGVPPDYFSETGQLWGNPLYDWGEMENDSFRWWLARIRRNLALCDLIRVDHFRGLVQYWAVPSGHENAINGRWRPVPVMELFESISREFGEIPLVAENLGIITEDVTEVMEKLGLPGMLVLQFSFSEDFPQNPYAPHNHGRNNFVYTGTHDNSTTREWFTHEASDNAKRIFRLYTGKDINDENAAMELMRLSMNSVAHTSITPVQDILNLGREARMNRPSVRYNNWEWRARAGMLDRKISERLREMTRISGRN